MNNNENKLDEIFDNFIAKINNNPMTSNYIFWKEDDDNITEAKAELNKHFISRESVEEAIGEDYELRAKEDMLEAVYHRLKGKNELKAELRANLLSEEEK